MQKFGLVSLVEILSGVDSDHGSGPRKYSTVYSRSTLFPLFIKKAMLTKDVPLSSHLADYVL